MIKEIDVNKLSSYKTIHKICMPEGKTDSIKVELRSSLKNETYDQVSIHAGTNNISSSQPKQVAANVIDLAESAIKLNPDIEVSVSGLIATRNTEQTKSIRLANDVIKTTCDDRGWIYIDNSHINIQHLKSSSIHLNKVGVKLLASNFIRQALRSTGRSIC